MSAVNGYTRSLGGMETPVLLGVTRVPDMNVPECVVEGMSSASVPEGKYGVSVMACVSNMACVEMDRPIQTGDGDSEPNGPLVSISGTVPVSRDVAYGARSAFSEQPSRASSCRESGVETLHVGFNKASRMAKMV